MNKEQQRIALAEWEGWHNQRFGDGVDYWMTPDGKFGVNQVNQSLEPPNYPKDLNACHEAEKKIRGTSTWDGYYRWLVCCLDEESNSDFGDDTQNYIHATAAQRTEALCRTLFPERFE